MTDEYFFALASRRLTAKRFLTGTSIEIGRPGYRAGSADERAFDLNSLEERYLPPVRIRLIEV